MEQRDITGGDDVGLDVSQEIYMGMRGIEGRNVFDGLLGFFDGLPLSSSSSPFDFVGLLGNFDGLPPSGFVGFDGLSPSSSSSPFGFVGFDGLPPSPSCSPFGFDGLLAIFDGSPPSSPCAPFAFVGLLGIFDGLPPSSSCPPLGFDGTRVFVSQDEGNDVFTLLGVIDGWAVGPSEQFWTSCSVDEVEIIVARNTTNVRNQKVWRRMLRTSMVLFGIFSWCCWVGSHGIRWK